ncbi:MAG: hypothetical protein IKN56_06945 [Clostridia bacterium]|nr:hypothetical protein [Clostridia bacterium]
MNCAYCDAVMPDTAEACPECGKPVDKTGLGGTLKFFDMKSNVRMSGILYLLFPVIIFSAVAFEFQGFFRYGFGYHSFGLFEIILLILFIAGVFMAVCGILHIKNAGKCFFSIKNHGVKSVYPTVFGTTKYIECKYEDISYAYISKMGKHRLLKIGTPDGEHKISGLNVLDEQFINSHINTAILMPEEETENE